MSQINNLAYLV